MGSELAQYIPGLMVQRGMKSVIRMTMPAELAKHSRESLVWAVRLWVRG